MSVGASPAARMALLSANRADAWCVGVAAHISRLATTWLHPLASLDDQIDQIEDCEAEILVIDADAFLLRGGELAARAAGVRHVFTLGGAEYGVDLLSAVETVGSAAARDLAGPDDVAALSYTGGTVQNMLDMTSGIAWSEDAYTPDETIIRMYKTPDPTEFVLSQPMSDPPGARFYYNGGNPYVLSDETLGRELNTRGFIRLMRWTRGVDCNLFRPRAASIFEFPRPIFLTCSRVAVEKNLEAFLSLDLPGSKVVIGDGPARRKLQRRFPGAHFVGEMRDEKLAAAYASADVFVFPSLTDTFGLVLLEALASGLPVAANPVVGPLDVIGDSGAGVLDANLGRAALAALSIPKELARVRALTFSLSESARQFVENVFAAHWDNIRQPRLAAT
jgi:Glycosyl transferases group 1